MNDIECPKCGSRESHPIERYTSSQARQCDNKDCRHAWIPGRIAE